MTAQTGRKHTRLMSDKRVRAVRGRHPDPARLSVYVGASACHLAVGDGLGAITTPLVLAAITLASWALRPPARRDPAPLAVPSWTRPLTDQQPDHRGSGLLHRT